MKTAIVNMNTNKVVRVFESEKSARKFVYLYNDLCGRTAFTTKKVK